MFLKVLILTLIPIGCLSLERTKNHTGCDTKDSNFVESCHKFVQCVMQNNKIASFCTKCKENYATAMGNYREFTSDEKCVPEYITNNQLNLVETLYANTKHYWDIGFCSGDLSAENI